MKLLATVYADPLCQCSNKNYFRIFIHLIPDFVPGQELVGKRAESSLMDIPKVNK